MTILGFAAITAARPGVALPLRGLGPDQVLHVTLMEDDGTSWSRAVPVDSTWSEPLLPLASFAIGHGADRPRLERLERLQLSLRRADGAVIPAGRYGVEVEWVMLEFGGGAADR